MAFKPTFNFGTTVTTNQLNDEFIIVATTESDKINADKLATEILRRKLAACVNTTEINSRFWWDGKIEKNAEVQLLIKTKKKNLSKLVEAINELHSYTIPELMYWEAYSSSSYSEWIEQVIS